MKSRAPPGPRLMGGSRSVAVHESVIPFMRRYSEYSHVQKWCALCDDLLDGDEAVIQMTLRRLDTVKIRGDMLEVGPKRKK